MKKILYIDACLHRDRSRTEKIAKAYLALRGSVGDCETETLVLETAGLVITDEKRLDLREKFIEAGDYSAEIFAFARKFCKADEVVISAPCWDMSFPASLKLYIENICINGLTFRYTPVGAAEGLTSVRSLVYITTSGGYAAGEDPGYRYVKDVFQTLFGIENCRCIRAEGLDIYGSDADGIVNETIKNMTVQFFEKGR